MQNRSDMNISTLLTSLYLQKEETVPPAAEVRQSLAPALPPASIADGNGVMFWGEIKPERMPQWAKDALKTIQKEQKAKHSREER